jgi:plastocyanin
LAISALAVAALASAVEAVSPPVAWQANVGAATRDGAVQVNAFLPVVLTVNEGDSVTWTLRSGEFHTVTFLSGAAAPSLILPPAGPNEPPSINPAVAAPSGGSTYDGTGIVNSGLLSADPPSPNTTFKLTFTKAGTYHYVCLIHAGMGGTLHVNAAGSYYPRSQTTYNLRARVDGNLLMAAGRNLQARTLASARSSGARNITMGDTKSFRSVGSVAVFRFLPGQIVIHAGQTVTWNNIDPEVPHTVTFGTEPPGGPFAAFGPSGATVPGAPGTPNSATLGSPGTAANSGFIGAGLPFGTTFTAKFTAPGTYHYICVLHDTLGMKGTIIVLP